MANNYRLASRYYRGGVYEGEITEDPANGFAG